MKKILAISILILIAFVPVMAENFVNWAAGYYVELPEGWYHVPYSTVNIFLQTQDVDLSVFEYDAVIAPQSELPFFEGPYVFLIHHEEEELTSKQIDSVLLEVANDYQKRHKSGDLKSGNQLLQLDQPIYDKNLKTVVTKSRVTSEYTDKYLLEVRKFYKKGVAIFLCYSPKDRYNEMQPKFFDLFNSMITENLEAAAPKESAQVVDVKDKELPSYDDSEFPEPDSGNTGFNKIWLVAILIVFMVIIVVRIAVSKKSKK